MRCELLRLALVDLLTRASLAFRNLLRNHDLLNITHYVQESKSCRVRVTESSIVVYVACKFPLETSFFKCELCTLLWFGLALLYCHFPYVACYLVPIALRDAI